MKRSNFLLGFGLIALSAQIIMVLVFLSERNPFAALGWFTAALYNVGSMCED